MSEVKSRTRGGRRTAGSATPAPDVTADVPAPDVTADVPAPDVTADVPAPDVTADVPAPDVTADAPGEVPAAEVTTAPDGVAGAGTADPDPAGAQDVPMGWADAVPWLALRWGSAPSAAEVRCAPMVWRMLAEQSAPGRSGRTALQMAAEAELAGHTELDPAVLAKVLARFEKAGVVRVVTDGRLARWSVLDPADIVAAAIESARESVRSGGSAARTGGGAGVASRVGAGPTPAGGLRGLVEDHLAEHPVEDFSPSQVAKVLGRSSGAVANALERLVVTGVAIQTSLAPRRYQHRADAATTGGPADARGTADGVADGGEGAQE